MNVQHIIWAHDLRKHDSDLQKLQARCLHDELLDSQARQAIDEGLDAVRAILYNLSRELEK